MAASVIGSPAIVIGIGDTVTGRVSIGTASNCSTLCQ